MKRFVFRAQVALDLRKRQEEDARRTLALAEARERDARDALEETQRLLDDMLQRGRGEDASGDVTAGIWYRNWVVGQRQRIARCREVLVERERATAAAAGEAQAARRRARSLERFRERAWQRYTREEAREEQKLLDDLGAIRFAVNRSHAGGSR